MHVTLSFFCVGCVCAALCVGEGAPGQPTSSNAEPLLTHACVVAGCGWQLSQVFTTSSTWVITGHVKLEF
jgi:hypothetical protein